MTQDMGEWLKQRAAERGTPIQAADAPASSRGPEFWFAVAASGAAAIGSFGWLLFPYHPIRTTLLLGLGLTAIFVSFVGMYVMAFAFMRAIPVSIRLTGPLFLVASLLGVANAGHELWKRTNDLEREAAQELVPDLMRARARGWVADR